MKIQSLFQIEIKRSVARKHQNGIALAVKGVSDGTGCAERLHFAHIFDRQLAKTVSECFDLPRQIHGGDARFLYAAGANAVKNRFEDGFS